MTTSACLTISALRSYDFAIRKYGLTIKAPSRPARPGVSHHWSPLNPCDEMLTMNFGSEPKKFALERRGNSVVAISRHALTCQRMRIAKRIEVGRRNG